MKILVTGAKGFIGKNLIAELRNRNYKDILEFSKDSDPVLLDEFCREADFVFHLAGINRPNHHSEYMEGNLEFTNTLINTINRYNNNCPIMISSSVQAELNNLYGISKKAAESIVIEHGNQTGNKVFVYRLPNVFGKWCKPNYNSVVATFCHNIGRDIPISVNDENAILHLVYIDDVIEELINALEGNANKNGVYCEIPTVHTVSLKEIVDLLYSFKKSRVELSIPDFSNVFAKKLYSTYLSFLPKDKFSYELKMNLDNRGSFSEFIKTPDRGQVSVNISKPGITKGNHWHHTKNEKFLVVSGNGVIRFRRLDSNEIIEYFVSGEKLEVLDIPVGYTHNIENLSNTDMVTIMWANEYFDPEKPDTYYSEV
jgi:UDP-2-acetamido-2,6-beta-L-arabino-hexul-4-ose reductase